MADLRSFVDELEREDELLRVKQAFNLNYVAAVLGATPKAVFFERLHGYDMPLVGGVSATRSKLALALGAPRREILQTIARRVAAARSPVLVQDGPVKARRYVGQEVDLTMLPIHLQHEKDGGPYISAAVDITRAATGGHNLGLRRLMIVDSRHTTIDLRAPSDLRVAYLRALERREPLDLAIAIGLHPAYQVAALLKTPAPDAYTLLASVGPEPLELVAAETVDLLVPAAAEVVLEGTISAAGYTEVEGPYGEFLGSYGPASLNPRIEIKAITHRERPIFETITISGKHLSYSETSQLAALRTEHMLWEILRHAIPQPVNVYSPPAASLLNAIAAIKQTHSGDGKNALLAILASMADVKFAVVVDDDIDIFDLEQVQWAISTRSQPDRDLVVLNDSRGMPLDPSMPATQPPFYTAKLGIDATKSASLPSSRFEVPSPPFAAMVTERLDQFLAGMPAEEMRDIEQEKLEEELLRLMESGARRYHDLLVRYVNVPQRRLLRAVASLTERQEIHRTPDGSLARSSGG